MADQPKQRMFFGVQPTGKLHIGNYIGAINQWVENQDEFENIFCVVDLHALTVPDVGSKSHCESPFLNESPNSDGESHYPALKTAKPDQADMGSGLGSLCGSGRPQDLALLLHSSQAPFDPQWAAPDLKD